MSSLLVPAGHQLLTIAIITVCNGDQDENIVSLTLEWLCLKTRFETNQPEVQVPWLLKGQTIWLFNLGSGFQKLKTNQLSGYRPSTVDWFIIPYSSRSCSLRILNNCIFSANCFQLLIIYKNVPVITLWCWSTVELCNVRRIIVSADTNH